MRKQIFENRMAQLVLLCFVVLLFGIFGIGMSLSRVPNLRLPADINIDARGGYCHLSVDDCNTLLEDLTKNEETYKSIFDQRHLGFLKKLHDDYGIVVSLYFFFRGM